MMKLRTRIVLAGAPALWWDGHAWTVLRGNEVPWVAAGQPVTIGGTGHNMWLATFDVKQHLLVEHWNGSRFVPVSVPLLAGHRAAPRLAAAVVRWDHAIVRNGDLKIFFSERTVASPPTARATPRRAGLCCYVRSGRRPARTSSEKICGCSQAAKWPPLSGWL
jgi:hypothetical protein